NHSNSPVYLTGVTTPPSSRSVVLDQFHKTFSQRLLPVVQGQEVLLWNRDLYSTTYSATTRFTGANFCVQARRGL
ncbi:MAG: hypothetical protein GY790_14510, partial [Bacteroidetes bacterium]|nr:hypothetical protein [Bacteroidota bacterium]